jgi:3-oxoacyl-[acyl-carrier protein] reductase
MAKEWGRYKVNVNAVAFGPIRTRLTEGSAKGDSTIKIDDKEIRVGVNPELLHQMEQMIPLGRVGTPEEAAGAVYLFCLPESNFISGQHVICGGGFTI